MTQANQPSTWNIDDRVYFGAFDINGTVCSLEFDDVDEAYVYLVMLDDSAFPIHIAEPELSTSRPADGDSTRS